MVLHTTSMGQCYNNILKVKLKDKHEVEDNLGSFEYREILIKCYKCLNSILIEVLESSANVRSPSS